MNRRSFFKTLGCAAPTIFIPKLIVACWKPLVKPVTRSIADIELYNKLPFYLVKMQIERRQNWEIWRNFLGKKQYKLNMGDTTRIIV